MTFSMLSSALEFVLCNFSFFFCLSLSLSLSVQKGSLSFVDEAHLCRRIRRIRLCNVYRLVTA